jgi:hypothetical protein
VIAIKLMTLFNELVDTDTIERALLCLSNSNKQINVEDVVDYVIPDL